MPRKPPAGAPENWKEGDPIEVRPGVWRKQLFVGRDELGRQVRRKVTFKAAGIREARRIAGEKEREARESGERRKRVLLADMAETWWTHWMRSHHSVNTEQGYRRLLDRRIKPDLGHLSVDKITPATVATYYGSLHDRGLKASTILSYHNIVKQVLDQAVHDGAIKYNPADVAQRPKGPKKGKKRIVVPELEVIAKLIAAACRPPGENGKRRIGSPAVQRMLFCAFGLGTRRGELAGIRWSSVNLETGHVRIDQSVTDYRTGKQVKETKTEQEREIPLHSAVAFAIEAQMEFQRERAAAVGVDLVADPWLWAQEIDGGEPPEPHWIGTRFRSACKQAGVKGVRLHDFRHAFATFMLALGANMADVSTMLGHANPSTTWRVYSHADPSGLVARTAIDRLPVSLSMLTALALPSAVDTLLDEIEAEIVEDDDV